MNQFQNQINLRFAQLEARLAKLEGRQSKIALLTVDECLNQFRLGNSWNSIVLEANERKIHTSQVIAEKILAANPGTIARAEAIDSNNRVLIERFIDA